jgi:hypothetical protein
MMFGYIRTQMVLVALYLGVFIVVLSSAVSNYFTSLEPHHTGIRVYGPAALYAVGLIPLIFMLFELSTVIPLLVRISSTEQNIHGDCVNSTLRVMKSRRALRALHNISCFMANIDIMASKCLDAARSSSTFSGISKEHEQLLMHHCELHIFKPGKKIIHQHKHNKKMYIISEGSAEVLVDGVVKALLIEGKEFGKISMFTNRPCNASVVVHDEMICFALRKDAVREILGDLHFQDAEESFVDIAGGERSLTPDHLARKAGKIWMSKIGRKGKHQTPRRSSLLEINKWNLAKDWITRGRMVQLNHSLVLGLDTNKDGMVNAYLVDRNNDGVVDAIGYDDNGNGFIDRYDSSNSIDFRVLQQIVEGGSKISQKDSVGIGGMNSIGIDTSGDGEIDTFMVDTTGDGSFDTVGFDTTGNGQVDAFDTSGDGLPDIIKGSMADLRRKTRSPAVLAQQRKLALIDLFHAIDSGGDGSIDGQEMYHFLKEVSGCNVGGGGVVLGVVVWGVVLILFFWFGFAHDFTIFFYFSFLFFLPLHNCAAAL